MIASAIECNDIIFQSGVMHMYLSSPTTISSNVIFMVLCEVSLVVSSFSYQWLVHKLHVYLLWLWLRLWSVIPTQVPERGPKSKKRHPQLPGKDTPSSQSASRFVQKSDLTLQLQCTAHIQTSLTSSYVLMTRQMQTKRHSRPVSQQFKSRQGVIRPKQYLGRQIPSSHRDIIVTTTL